MFDALTLPLVGALAPDRRSKPSLFARIVKSVMEARQRQADHHIALYIERHGGRITDAVERGILADALGQSRGL